MAVLALSVLLTACQAGATAGPTPDRSAPTSPTPRTAGTPAVLGVSSADAALKDRPNAQVAVRASTGTSRAVSLADARGERVPRRSGRAGALVSRELLRPATANGVTLDSTGPDGTRTRTSATFPTLKLAVPATYTLKPSGGTVGVGMPAIVHFDAAVTTKSLRAEIERRVKVTTVPVQQGAWGWLDNRQLMWRPRNPWIPGTEITVSTPLKGAQTGKNTWITRDDRRSFRVGPSMVSTVDMKAHTMKVRRNGLLIRTFLVSTGKPQTETRSGTKVIIERRNPVTMDSATVGIPKGHPDYYKISVQWAMRLTWTGEYTHSAPWSVSSQGRANVSHGCTNMAPADAEWLYNNSKMGDLVKFTGSSRALKPTDGIGVWVYDYAGWKAQSAFA